MSKSSEEIEKIKQGFESGKSEFRPDDSRVIIAEMQINAIKEMASDKNEAFSEINSNEVFDVSRAIMFSRSALPSVSERLEKRGVPHTFSLPILDAFIVETFRNRHKIDRKRISEYLEGLKAVAPKQNNMFTEEPKRNLMSRLI